MYNHKLSPPVQSAITPRTLMSNLDNGYSSTHHRSRADRENGRSTDTDTTDRPTSPQDHSPTAANPPNGNSTPSNSTSLASTLYGMKKARLPYQQQPESPKTKKRSRGLFSSFLDSKHSQTLFLLSLLVNLVLVGIVLASFSRSLPTCLHSSSPLHAEEMRPQALGLQSIDAGNTNLFSSSTEAEQQPDIPTPSTEPVQQHPAQPIDTPVTPPAPAVVEPAPPQAVAEAQPAATPVQPEQPQQPAPPADVPAAAPAPVAPVAPVAAEPLASQSLPATDRPFADDLSENEYNVDTHTITWEYCLAPAAHVSTFTYAELGNLSITPDFATFPNLHCPTTPTVEQHWQIGWYGGQVAVGVKERNFPLPQKCVQLPPANYVWPKKYTDLPAADQTFLNWPNLRVNQYEELIVFNEGTPKNLYHFNAPRYDLDGLDELSLGAKYIPFTNKVRNFLDIGAGGGSLGLLLKRKYGVEAMSIIFPDWPYCEYITERGGLCVLVDVMEAMPFARASFDAVHISWVYHGQQPTELIQMYTEIDRIVRPGGYIWQRGGWSLSQIAAQKAMFTALGYVQLYEKLDVKPEDITKRISFGENLPFEAEWTCIYVKPIRAERKAGCESAPELVTVKMSS